MTRRLSLLVATSAVLVAGCGGDDGGGEQLGRAEIVKKTNAICTSYTKKLKALRPPTGNVDLKAAAKFYDQAADLTDGQQKEFTDLTPDGDVKKDFDAFVSAEGEGAKAVRTLAQVAAGGDPSKGKSALESLSTISQRLDSSAKKLGATSCGAASSS